MRWEDVKFKECAVHTELRYASEKCPVCEREELVRKLVEISIRLESQVESLQMLQATAAAE